MIDSNYCGIEGHINNTVTKWLSFNELRYYQLLRL